MLNIALLKARDCLLASRDGWPTGSIEARARGRVGLAAEERRVVRRRCTLWCARVAAARAQYLACMSAHGMDALYFFSTAVCSAALGFFCGRTGRTGHLCSRPSKFTNTLSDTRAHFTYSRADLTVTVEALTALLLAVDSSKC